MNRGASFLKTVAFSQVPKRTKAYTGVIRATMNDLPQPQGSWKVNYDANQRKYNAQLVGGIAFFVFTMCFGYAKGCFFLNTTPKAPGPKIEYK